MTTTDPQGLILYIRSDDVSPEIAFSDLLIKSPTSGAIITSYTAVSGIDQALWSVDSQVTDEPVDTDVRVQNLWSYPDAAGGGTTAYTVTLIYTVINQ